MRATDVEMTVIEHKFANSDLLAKELAGRVAHQLSRAIEVLGSASLAVSGGSTPNRLFQKLAECEIDWAKVIITLIDDRIVPPDHERSNERMVRQLLLQKNAAAAQFVPLWSEGEDTPAQLALRATHAVDAIARPFDMVVLGMGTDGHTASFFPGGSNLTQATDPACNRSVLDMEAPGAGEPRLTITLPRIIEAGSIILHIEGEEKQRVLEKARSDNTVSEMPVRAVLIHAHAPVNIYWAP